MKTMRELIESWVYRIYCDPDEVEIDGVWFRVASGCVYQIADEGGSGYWYVDGREWDEVADSVAGYDDPAEAYDVLVGCENAWWPRERVGTPDAANLVPTVQDENCL